MQFLVKPANEKFEGYCFGSSYAKQDCVMQYGCNADYAITFPNKN